MANLPKKLRDAFAKRLRELRLSARLSQRELGRRIGLPEDVVSSRVTRYEKGTSEPDFETAGKLAKELGVPLSYLVADSDLLAELILLLSKMSPGDQRRILASLKGKSSSR